MFDKGLKRLCLNNVSIINNVTAKDSGHKQRPELNFAIRRLHGNLAKTRKKHVRNFW